MGNAKSSKEIVHETFDRYFVLCFIPLNILIRFNCSFDPLSF